MILESVTLSIRDMHRTLVEIPLRNLSVRITTPPIPFIQSIKVSGDQAQIDILFGAADAPKGKVPNARDNRGRVVFYLKQLPQGWRIVNKLEFRRWPLKLDGESADCNFASLSYHFALEPRTAADLTFLPPACQKLERQTLPK